MLFPILWENFLFLFPRPTLYGFISVKKTKGYPVDTISNLYNFEIALYVDAAWLPAVKVKNSNYKLDSLQNRQEYAKVFNFRKPKLMYPPFLHPLMFPAVSQQVSISTNS